MTKTRKDIKSRFKTPPDGGHERSWKSRKLHIAGWNWQLKKRGVNCVEPLWYKRKIRNKTTDEAYRLEFGETQEEDQ